MDRLRDLTDADEIGSTVSALASTPSLMYNVRTKGELPTAGGLITGWIKGRWLEAFFGLIRDIVDDESGDSAPTGTGTECAAGCGAARDAGLEPCLALAETGNVEMVSACVCPVMRAYLECCAACYPEYDVEIPDPCQGVP